MPAGSIHFSSRAPKGYVAISSSPLATNQGFKSLVPIQGVLNEYVYYYLKASTDLARKRASGTIFLEISGTAFVLLRIPLPPSNEQQCIVAKVEELFSELDKGIESLKIALAQLKMYRQAVFKNAFEGKLTVDWRKTAQPAASETTTLGSRLSFLTSGSRGWARYYSGEGDIFIRAQNLKYDRLDLDDVACVTLPEGSEGTRTQVQAGDLLITITDANVTKTGYVPADLGTAYVSQHVALCRPTADLDSKFLYWYLIAECAGRRQLNAFAYGAGKPGLNLDNIRSVRLDLPPLAEQKAIVKQIDRLLSVQETMNAIIDTELKRVEALRQSILKRAFSGRLVPQDPNEEPAAILLERIKAEKAAVVTIGKRGGGRQTA